jgi:putative peptide zinc metalloprotease protein
MDAAPDIPRRADGLVLGAAHAGETTRVASLPEGRHFEISSETAALLELIDGRRTLGEIAEALAMRNGDATAAGAAVGEGVGLGATTDGAVPAALDAEALRVLIERTLRPSGLAYLGEAPEGKQAPPSHMWLRRSLIPAETVRTLARALVPLFSRRLAAPLVAVAALAHVAFYLTGPQLELANGLFHFGLWWPPAVIFAVSLIVHELGHAAALMAGGERPGAIGAGFYYVCPVMFTDVDAAWRLSRRSRAVVDMGGIYVQLLFAALTIGVYAATRSGVAARAIALIDLGLIANLNPFLRMDGYWLLADLTGTRDLRGRTQALALGLFGVGEVRGDAGDGTGGAADTETPSRFIVVYTWASLAYFVAACGWLVVFAIPRLLVEMHALAGHGIERKALQAVGVLALVVIGAALWVGARSVVGALRTATRDDR